MQRCLKTVFSSAEGTKVDEGAEDEKEKEELMMAAEPEVVYGKTIGA